MRRSVSLLLLAAGCGTGGGPPPLPPLALHPVLPSLEKIIAGAPQPPGKARRAELRDLVDLALGDGNAQERFARMARRNLLAQPDAFEGLEEGLEHADAALRGRAAEELGRLGRQPSILPLLLRLKYEQDPAVTGHVAAALARLGNDAGLAVLVSMMQDARTAREAGLRAIEVLRRAGVEVAAAPTYAELTAALDRRRRAWRRTGGPPGDDASPVEDLTRARIARHLVHLQGFALRPVDDARFVLQRAGRLAVPLLAEAVRAREPYLRMHALEIARDLGRAAAPLAGPILPLLADPLSRALAARSLGSIGAGEALPHLLAMLADADPELRAAAAGALGPLGDRKAVPALQAVLASQDETMDVRVQAAFSLAIFELDRPAYRFLEERRARGDYHGPTIDELLERIDRYR